MKKMILMSALFVGNQAFGLILGPGESWQFGDTTVRCYDSRNEIPVCRLKYSFDPSTRVGHTYQIFVGEDAASPLTTLENDALETIQRYKRAGICR